MREVQENELSECCGSPIDIKLSDTAYRGLDAVGCQHECYYVCTRCMAKLEDDEVKNE